MSIGKTLTQPLLVMLVTGIISWIILVSRTWKKGKRLHKVLLALIGMALATIWTLSLPVTALLLEESLVLETKRPEHPPEIIAVLAGGYAPPGAGRLLSSDTMVRLLAGIDWWREYPEATLVMSGGSAGKPTTTGREMPDLMAEEAIARGVPEEKILIESRSLNTRQHPVEILNLSGIDSRTRVAVVTSRWHLRRAAIEFRRHFDTVTPLGYPYPEIEIDLGSWIPQTPELARSTTMLHEWIGMIWYGVLDVTNTEASDPE